MNRRFYSVLAIIGLVLSVTPSQAALKAKAGTKCPKVNSIQTISGKKFTCIKQGKKLVWDKGRLNLFAPIFTTRAESNNYEWSISVTNYAGELGKGLEFTYFYSLDQAPFVLYWTKKSQTEKISIDTPFSNIRFKVIVTDGGNQEKSSEVFEKSFRTVVTPPNSAKPEIVYSPQIDQSQFLNPISGVQWRNESGSYIGDKPKARILLRWPKQSDPSLRGYIVVYENTETVTPPCDLQKALCEGPKRFDSKIYKQIVNQAATESLIVENLEINSSYLFGVIAVLGGTETLEDIAIPRFGRSIFVRTSGEAVPGAPVGVIIG